MNLLVIQSHCSNLNHHNCWGFNLYTYLSYMYFIFFCQLLWIIPPLGFRQQRQKRRQPSELSLIHPVLTAKVLSAPPLSSTEPTCVCYTGTRWTRNILRSATACKITSLPLSFEWYFIDYEGIFTSHHSMLHVQAMWQHISAHSVLHNSGSHHFLSDVPTVRWKKLKNTFIHITNHVLNVFSWSDIKLICYWTSLIIYK